MSEFVNKRRLAFEWSCQKLGDQLPRLYMWTFTFAEVLSVTDGCNRWDVLLTVLRREMPHEWQGIRTYEMHPGGHGLHIHVIIDRYVRVEKVRHFAEICGFGRIDVQAIPVEHAPYIGKYLAKKRPPALKHKRLFAPFGPRAQKVTVRICNIVRDCRLTRAWKWAKTFIPDWSELSFQRRKIIVSFMVKNSLRSEVGADLIPLPATF